MLESNNDTYAYTTVLVVDLVLGCCLGGLKGTIFGAIIGEILTGFNFYVLFYSLQEEVNQVSLLLFWADLWATLFVIYTTIERYIKRGEFVERKVEFSLQNYI
ncbi:19492_t:CDS:2 [Entrophospora sp. SA101]|nr:19492_t:CDS:2 [Entrophospora sp. SA101]